MQIRKNINFLDKNEILNFLLYNYGKEINKKIYNIIDEFSTNNKYLYNSDYFYIYTKYELPNILFEKKVDNIYSVKSLKHQIKIYGIDNVEKNLINSLEDIGNELTSFIFFREESLDVLPITFEKFFMKQITIDEDFIILGYKPFSPFIYYNSKIFQIDFSPEITNIVLMLYFSLLLSECRFFIDNYKKDAILIYKKILEIFGGK